MLLRLMMVTALVVPAFADDRRDRDRDWSRDDRRRESNRNNGRYNGNYGNSSDRYSRGNSSYGNSGYGYRNDGYSQNNSIFRRTLQDLQSAASRNRVDSHERDHFNRAMSELRNMNQGAVDSRRLSRVLEDLDHLSNAHQVNPRDRQILARDRQALASMAGGYGYNRW